MRSSDSGHLFRNDEMFHIPFELRGNVKNQRYSISGYPCLYLGRSLYVCWEELGRPIIDTCNMAAIESDKELLFINLRMPTQIKIKDQLYRIPLIIASSLKVHNSNYTFKQEYIIPQILVQCVLKRNTQGGMRIKEIKSIIDGIKYTSTHFNDKQRLFKDINLFTNYVIPVKTINKEGLCSELCKTFKISKDSTLLNILKIYNSFNQGTENVATEIDESTSITDITRLYKKSLFGIIEKLLDETEKTNLKPKTDNKKTFIITKAQMDALIENGVQERINLLPVPDSIDPIM